MLLDITRGSKGALCAHEMFIFALLSFYCFMTTHFPFVPSLLAMSSVPGLGMHLLHGSCLHNWAIKLRLSPVSRGIWSHRTVLQDWEKAKGKELHGSELYGLIRKLPVINPADSKTSLV